MQHICLISYPTSHVLAANCCDDMSRIEMPQCNEDDINGFYTALISGIISEATCNSIPLSPNAPVSSLIIAQLLSI